MLFILVLEKQMVLREMKVITDRSIFIRAYQAEPQLIPTQKFETHDHHSEICDHIFFFIKNIL